MVSGWTNQRWATTNEGFLSSISHVLSVFLVCRGLSKGNNQDTTCVSRFCLVPFTTWRINDDLTVFFFS
jgi:hypothetical protein